MISKKELQNDTMKTWQSNNTLFNYTQEEYDDPYDYEDFEGHHHNDEDDEYNC